MVYNAPARKGITMYYLPPKKEKKTPQIDVFVQTPEGGFISLNELEQRRQKLEGKIDIAKQRIEINKKLIKNHDYNFCRNILWGLCIASACCTFMFSSNKELHKKVAFGTLGAGVVDMGVGIFLSKREKKLKKQDAFLKTQEQRMA